MNISGCKKRMLSPSAVGIGRVWEMMKFIPVLCMCLALLIGCGEPNLDDPKVREKILAKAIDDSDLQTRWTPSGAKKCVIHPISRSVIQGG